MERSTTILVALFLIACSAQQSFHSRRIGTEGQIISRILSEYDATTRPPIRDHADNSAILVITSVFINRVEWREGLAQVDLYLRQQWQDTRLKYEIDSREGIDEIRLPANRRIWQPDTYFVSGREMGGRENGAKSLVVEPTGYVRSSQRISLEVPFNHATTFPFSNSHSFTIKLASYNYDIDDIVYLWANSPPLVNPIEVSSDLLTARITFEEANAGDCVGNYTIGVYSCIDAHITFASCTFSAIFTWFLPTLLLLIASWLHFWIHGSWSVPRSVSAAGPFFILVAYYLFKNPGGSNGQHIWISFCLFLTFLSLIEYFLVICFGIRRSIRYNNLGNQEDHPMGAAKETLEVAYNSGCSSFRANDGIDIISRVLFPIITIIFLIIYFIFV